MLKAIAVLHLLATPVLADDFIFFHSPSGNINCMLMSGEDASGVRCDMLEFTPSFRNRPADCDLDWGDAFEVGVIGRGTLSSHGDTVIDPGSMELGYGASATLGEFTCLSEETGVTCTNGRGHGFAISKVSQKLF